MPTGPGTWIAECATSRGEANAIKSSNEDNAKPDSFRGLTPTTLLADGPRLRPGADRYEAGVGVALAADSASSTPSALAMISRVLSITSGFTDTDVIPHSTSFCVSSG